VERERVQERVRGRKLQIGIRSERRKKEEESTRQMRDDSLPDASAWRCSVAAELATAREWICA